MIGNVSWRGQFAWIYLTVILGVNYCVDKVTQSVLQILQNNEPES